MSTSLERSQALTRAAQKLSTARKRLQAAENMQDRGELVVMYDRYVDAVDSALIAYRAAYAAYTNPFGVSKWV